MGFIDCINKYFFYDLRKYKKTAIEVIFDRKYNYLSMYGTFKHNLKNHHEIIINLINPFISPFLTAKNLFYGFHVQLTYKVAVLVSKTR